MPRREPNTAEACREMALVRFRSFLGFANHASGEAGLHSISRHLRQAPHPEAVTLGMRMSELIRANAIG